MSKGLIICPEAALEIQDRFEWYEAQTLGLGAEFVRAVDACLSGIGRDPLAHPILYRQARRALVRRFPYGILYVVDHDSLAAIACFHGKRDPRSWQTRL